jgi:mono/diheme cytochrome c family protein
MRQNDKHNSGGYKMFFFAFISICLFIVYVVYAAKKESKNPATRIDLPPTPAAGTFSKEEQAKRSEEWRKSTPEAIAAGKSFYDLNCLDCHSGQGTGDAIAASLQSGKAKHGLTIISFYNSMAKGFPGNTHRFDFVKKPDRWAVVHYLSSLVPNQPTVSSSEMKEFLATEW